MLWKERIVNAGFSLRKMFNNSFNTMKKLQLTPGLFAIGRTVSSLPHKQYCSTR